ncbi:MAG: histidine triad nucleotide-binding protein [Pseudomonadota bacterium]
MNTDPDCLFCKIVAGELPADIVFDNEYVVGFKDINPQAPVHVLFVPREHIPTANDLTEEHAELVGQVVLAARAYAKAEGLADDGYRLVMNCNSFGGQTVYHIHLHLLAGVKLPVGFGA